MLKKANPQQYQPANGANYPRGPLGNSLKQIAQLIKSDIGLEVAFTDVGGWDTHANEGGSTGQLANRLTDFSQSIAALYQDLGDKMQDVVVLTMSDGELLPFIDVRIPRYTVLNFEIEYAIVIREGEGFGVERFFILGCFDWECSEDIGI